MLVFGTRPEAIKMAPLVLKLKSEKKYFETRVCVTGQHRQMLDQVLNIFNIVPDFDMNIMKKDQDLFEVTINVLRGLKRLFNSYKPDVVLIHGDTTTSLATALSCFYKDIYIGHIEAGLRTNNIYAPFPEEFNRQIASKVTKWHFAPTERSRANLISENINPKDITVTGNTVIDAMYWVLNRIENDKGYSSKLTKQLSQVLKFNWHSKRFILITAHRRENFGEGFFQICEAIRKLSLKFNDTFFVYPVHLNPNVWKPVRDILKDLPNVYLIKPLDYEPFIYLLKHSYIVLTDSGGIQEEAPSLGIPVLVMRNVSERCEAIEAGTVKLVGANEKLILSKVSRLVEDQEYYLKMSQAHNPYGEGKACEKIINVLKNI